MDWVVEMIERREFYWEKMDMVGVVDELCVDSEER